MLPEIGNILAVLTKKHNHNYCYAPFGRSAVMIIATKKALSLGNRAFGHGTRGWASVEWPIMTLADVCAWVVCFDNMQKHQSYYFRGLTLNIFRHMGTGS